MSMADFDRFLFAYTIGSHIILVSASIGLILLLVILELMILRKNDSRYLTLIKRLKKMFVISFGIGTASGIVMAVEMVALFPNFMTLVSETGAIALFYAEIFTFFLETIALVLYVYFNGVFKWKYTSAVLSFVVLFGTLLSAVFITMVNAWMNTPDGFTLVSVNPLIVTNVDPWAPFATASTFSQVAHVLTTTVLAGAMLLGVFFAIRYLRAENDNEKSMASSALHIIGVIGIVDIILAGISGSHEMATILSQQPLKYAAFDLNYAGGSNMPETLFGYLLGTKVMWALSIPGLQSLLASFETGSGVVPGLSQFPANEWPPLLVHTTFDIMVVGGLLIGLFLFIMFLLFVMKKDPLKYRFMIYLFPIAGIFTFIVYELGWVTDEVGRQPWIVYNEMTVTQAINTSPGLLIPGLLIVAFYLILVPATFYFFSRIYRSSRASADLGRKEPEGGVNY